MEWADGDFVLGEITSMPSTRRGGAPLAARPAPHPPPLSFQGNGAVKPAMGIANGLWAVMGCNV
jgi:hypothetical protein